MLFTHKGEMMEENKTEEKIKEIENKKKTKKVIMAIITILVLIIIMTIVYGDVFIKKNSNKENNQNSDNNQTQQQNNNSNNNIKDITNEIERIEGDTCSSNDDLMVAYKPIIYLYPESQTEVTVKLEKEENLTCTYPKYKAEGWKVLAKPNGDLIDLKTGRNLYSLYWEGINTKKYDDKLEEGFVVKGEDTISFLEEKLEILGLSQTEAQEFIVYWLPKMENNKYNYIRFQTKEEIEENMPLEIEPKPDTIIRVMMEWKELDKYIEIEEQKLEMPERKGFVAVEWGGTEIK